jgi:hypothetical protein
MGCGMRKRHRWQVHGPPSCSAQGRAFRTPREPGCRLARARPGCGSAEAEARKRPAGRNVGRAARHPTMRRLPWRGRLRRLRPRVRVAASRARARLGGAGEGAGEVRERCGRGAGEERGTRGRALCAELPHGRQRQFGLLAPRQFLAWGRLLPYACEHRRGRAWRLARARGLEVRDEGHAACRGTPRYVAERQGGGPLLSSRRSARAAALARSREARGAEWGAECGSAPLAGASASGDHSAGDQQDRHGCPRLRPGGPDRLWPPECRRR